MAKVNGQVQIDVSAERAWELLSDFGGVHKWAPGVTNSYSTTPNNSGPDAARHCDIAGFGGLEEYVTDWNDTSKEFVYTFTPVGPISSGYSTWKVTSVAGGGSRVESDLVYNMRFGLIGSIMNKLIVRRRLQKGIDDSLAGLRHYAQTGELVDQKTELIAA